MAKKTLFILIASFLAYRSYELVITLWMADPVSFNLGMKLLFSLLLNLFITGVFAFTGFAFKTSQIAPEHYYQVENPQFVSRLYKLLGTEYFRRFLLIFFWGKQKNRKKYFDGTKQGIDNLDFQTRQSEFGHLGALVTIQLVVVTILLQGHLIIAILTTVVNIVSNFYPIVLQRHHRIQIQRIRSLRFRA